MYPIAATALCMSTSLMCLTFKEPLLQLRLKQDDLPVWLIGIIFSMDTITFTLSSLILNFIPEHKKNFKKLVCAGMIIFILSMLFTGPVYGLPDKVATICVGVLFGGCAGALINNNCVPALSAYLKNNVPNINKNQIKNNISAINTGAFGLGSIIGPILASILESQTNFRTAFTLLAGIVFLFSLGQVWNVLRYN